MTNWFLNKAEEIKNESVYDLVQDFVFSVVFIVMIAIFLSRVPAVAVNNIDFSIQVFFLLLIGFLAIFYSDDVYCILSNRLRNNKVWSRELRRY